MQYRYIRRSNFSHLSLADTPHAGNTQCEMLVFLLSHDDGVQGRVANSIADLQRIVRYTNDLIPWFRTHGVIFFIPTLGIDIRCICYAL